MTCTEFIILSLLIKCQINDKNEVFSICYIKSTKLKLCNPTFLRGSTSLTKSDN